MSRESLRTRNPVGATGSMRARILGTKELGSRLQRANGLFPMAKNVAHSPPEPPVENGSPSCRLNDLSQIQPQQC